WKDKHPMVRVNALRISESRAKEIENGINTVEGLSDFTDLVDDPDIRVRYQLGFTLGQIRNRGLLTKLAMKDFDNPQMQIAIMSSAGRQLGEMLNEVVSLGMVDKAPPSLIEQLINLATAIGDANALVEPLKLIAKPESGQYAPWQFSALIG